MQNTVDTIRDSENRWISVRGRKGRDTLSFRQLFYTFHFTLFTSHRPSIGSYLPFAFTTIIAIFIMFSPMVSYSVELAPSFQCAQYFYASSSQSRENLTEVHTYIKGNKSNLLFEKRNGSYFARIELNLAAYSDSKLRYQTMEIDSFVAPSYKVTTQSNYFILGPFKTSLPPGKYRFVAKLTDINSGKERMREQELKVPYIGQYGEPISSIMLYNSKGVPQVEKQFTAEDESLSYRFYVYKPIGWQKGIISTSLSREDKTFYSNITEFPSATTKIQVSNTIPLDTLPGGEYQLIATFKHDSLDYSRSTTLKLSFSGLSPIGNDFDIAIEVLSYIATSSELDSLRQKGLSRKEKLRRWKAFWKRRDPTPGTEENEAMEEFYRRVKYADQHFRGFKEGWRTDRGRIYITYGQPDEIERHPFDLDSPPFEIWYYYSERLNFVFVDENNNGEYRLYESYNR